MPRVRVFLFSSIYTFVSHAFLFTPFLPSVGLGTGYGDVSGQSLS